MDVVNSVSCAIGGCLDVLWILLDLIVWLLNWLSRVLSNMASSLLHDLPVMLTGSTLLEYWNQAQFSFLTVTEVVTSSAHGALHVLEGWTQTLGGVLESFKMVGHLAAHVVWRAKELLRGLISGNSVLKQTCEGFSIALSLVLYFVNTIVNVLLIGTQNCFYAAVGAWDTVSGPLHKALELALTLLTFLYSCLVGASVLLWAPFQLGLDFLGSLGHVFVTVFLLNIYGLLLTAVIVALALLYLNRRLPRLAARQCLHFVNTLPGMTGVQRAFYRFYLMALERAQAIQDNSTGQPAAGHRAPAGTQRGRTTQSSRGEGGCAPPGLDPRPPGSSTDHTDPPHSSELTGRDLGEEDSPQLHLSSRLHESPDPERSSAATRVPLKQAVISAPPADGLLSMLKEHEERKKCVICQDQAKNVLLLPCRHLCLCSPCSALLLQQPPQQHCCPLCRQGITQTMDVFL